MKNESGNPDTEKVQTRALLMALEVHRILIDAAP
jgi:hypothetical protein